MNYFNLPKIDLHCHLDGSVRPETIIALAAEQNITLPSNDIEEIRTLMIAPETCTDLGEYLQRFELPLSVMQTAEGLERISFEVFEDAAQENVKYLEVRFGPLLHHLRRGDGRRAGVRQWRDRRHGVVGCGNWAKELSVVGDQRIKGIIKMGSRTSQQPVLVH